MHPLQIKLTFINGLQHIVLNELNNYPDMEVISEKPDEFYCKFIHDFEILENLKSVTRAYIVIQDEKFNPYYVARHKSVVGNLIDFVVKKAGPGKFKTFKLSCAGSDSKEVRQIKEFIHLTYGLLEAEDADLKVHIIKLGNIWEAGVQTTPKPLSVRDYRVENIKGGLNPTIAYVMNSMCVPDAVGSYLNIFSGSATLLIEAWRLNPRLSFLGFDKDKKHISQAIQNIKKADLMRSIQLKLADIFDRPDFGTFDIITSDLPFGMQISKDEDLETLYQAFVEYCEVSLNFGGKLVVYTSEHEILEKALKSSKFKIVETMNLRFLTSVNAYLAPKIFVCEFK